MIVKSFDLHLGLSVAKAGLLVLAVFLLITFIFTYVAEAAESDLPAQLLLAHTLDMLPRQSQVILPFALFIGTLVGIGNLANANELTVLRVSGISVYRLLASTTVSVLVLLTVCWFISEYFLSEDHGNPTSDDLLVGTYSENEWFREGSLFTFVKRVSSQGELSGITQFRVGSSNSLDRVKTAVSGTYDEESSSWLLRDVRKVSINGDDISTVTEKEGSWQSVQTPRSLLLRRDAKPKELGLTAIWSQLKIASVSGTSTNALRNEFWTRVFRIFTTVSLTTLAFAFVLGSTREMGMGTRIALGMMVGLCFHLIQDFFAPISLVFPVHPVITMSVPVTLLFGIALILLRRVA